MKIPKNKKRMIATEIIYFTNPILNMADKPDNSILFSCKKIN